MNFQAKQIVFPDEWDYRRCERWLSRFFSIGVIHYLKAKLNGNPVSLVGFNYFKVKSPMVLEDGISEVTLA